MYTVHNLRILYLGTEILKYAIISEGLIIVNL